MNNDIDFSDFNKIEVQHTSKCRKFTKHKFLLFSLLVVIIIVIVVIIFIYKSRNYNKKDSELSNLKESINKIETKNKKLTNQISEAQSNLTLILNELSKTTDYDEIKSEFIKIDKTCDLLIYDRNDLLAKKEYITNQINYKNKSLKEDELKKDLEEKKNELEIIKQRLTDLSISNSNIKINANDFESQTETEILSKCYDSIVYGFHINKFYENCGGYPLLILIKTKTGKNIGAFASTSVDGNLNLEDEKSMLVNFDENKYFKNMIEDNNNCFIYYNSEEFPRFGNDLIIYRDGHGESKFPNCYSINGQSKKGDFIGEENFNIEVMEVYKLKLNI